MRYNAEVKADDHLCDPRQRRPTGWRLPVTAAEDVPALGGSVEVSQFFPDFRLTNDKVPVTYSQEFNNPGSTLIFDAAEPAAEPAISFFDRRAARRELRVRCCVRTYSFSVFFYSFESFITPPTIYRIDTSDRQDRSL